MRMQEMSEMRPDAGRHDISRRTLLVGAGLTALAVTQSRATADAATSPTTTPIRFGSWTNGMDANPSLLDTTSAVVRQPLSVASVFRGRGDTPYWPYDVDYRLGVQAGRILLVSWSLQDWGNFSWWASGRGDAILVKQAAAFAAYGGTIVVRPWAEMNGDWQNFQPRSSGPKRPYGGKPAEFVAAWRHVVDVVRSAGARNVRFCFNPTTDTYRGTTDVRTIFPGSSFVDVLGLDGYNWGTGSGFTWTSFPAVYATQYQRLVGLAPDKPLWICEVGSADPLNPGTSGVAVSAPTGDSKAQWWADMMASLRSGLPAVEAVVFFDCDKERNWALASSADAAAGLGAACANPPTRPVLRL